MKLRGKIAVGLVAVSALCAFLLLRSDNSVQTALKETRRTLRQQGFKTDLAEFNFSTSEELRNRAAALMFLNRPRPSVPLRGPLDLMPTMGSNSASVLWKQEALEGNPGEDVWTALHTTLNADRSALDAACEAALSGPIRFDLVAGRGNAMLLPHLGALKNLTQILGNRTVVELHDGNKDAAWTNLLASTRLVTSYDPEAVEISHLVRVACAAIAYHATWQALQADGWADDRLAQLQHEWESVDFFRGLPETAGFTRASMVATCQLERQQPLSAGMTLKEALHSPKYAWFGLTDYWRRLRYRQHGTFEDEKGLLLHYRDRELQLRRAVQCPTWSEMRSLPGVTNVVPFISKYPSAMQSMMNTRQIALSFQLQGQGLPGRAADAETRRRLVITAIALERYRGRHGSYPDTLQELVPDLLEKPPIDFMDGQPLRYRLTDDAHFVLYSVGLDCVDNYGDMLRPRGRGVPYEMAAGMGFQQGHDLVWPRPASGADLQAHEERQRQAREAEKQAMLERAVEEEKEADLRRARTLATLERLYAGKQPRTTNEPTYQGRPLSKLLRLANASETGQRTLDELLTVRQIITGDEPDIATFEVPIRYDVVTNIGGLHLLVDADPEEDSENEGGKLQECNRATNGNCLLLWNTTYDPPGRHFVQARLLYEEKQDSREVRGPLVPFLSTNVCQFDPFYSQFDSSGAILYARLPESNGTYTIELKSPTGDHVKTFTGSTSNGVIKVHWDLIDDRGKAYTNDSVDSVFQVTLPDSGRSQTLKGP